MKVYVLVEYMIEDYSGGGGSIVGVYDDWEKAFTEVKRQLRKVNRRAKKTKTEWHFPKYPCIDNYLTIEEYEVK